jgi:hypothetical protein
MRAGYSARPRSHATRSHYIEAVTLTILNSGVAGIFGFVHWQCITQSDASWKIASTHAHPIATVTEKNRMKKLTMVLTALSLAVGSSVALAQASAPAASSSVSSYSAPTQKHVKKPKKKKVKKGAAAAASAPAAASQ